MDKLFQDFFRNKRILVTGDTGFKGSWLCLWLHQLGAEVHGLAWPAKTPEDNFVKMNLGQVIRHTNGDVRDLNTVVDTFKKAKPELVFHLAAQSLVLPSYANPVETFQTNILGTVNVLEAVRQTPSVRVVINVTSDKCYQNNEWSRGYHEEDPMGGNDPYSASKGCSELVTHSYAKSFFNEGDCLIASARAGNVIGGGDWAEHRIIPDVFRAYFKGEELVVRNPKATRPWQYVLEPVFGYMKLAQTLFEKGRPYAGAWNFGPREGSDHTVADVIETIRKIIPDMSFRTDAVPPKLHEAQLLKLDISKALKHLAWRPLLSFEETIQMTIDGYLADRSTKDVYQQRAAQITQYVSKF